MTVIRMPLLYKRWTDTPGETCLYCGRVLPPSWGGLNVHGHDCSSFVPGMPPCICGACPGEYHDSDCPVDVALCHAVDHGDRERIDCLMAHHPSAGTVRRRS